MTKSKSETAKEKKTKQIRKRHLCCCYICGFIFGFSSVIGLIGASIYYASNRLNDIISSNGNSSVRPDAWIAYHGNCYYFSSFNATWKQAQETCLSMNSHLTDIQNQEEYTWIITKIIGEDIWIGGKGKNSTNFKWQYGPDLEPKSLNFSDWATGKPSQTVDGTAQQDCVQMWKSRGFRWDNEQCWKTRQFVCKHFGDQKG